MTVLFVLLLLNVPTATFETREECLANAAAKYAEGQWRCVAVPIRDEEADELE